MEHNLLTLDFWQDTVTYGKRTFPVGTIGCAALNITDEQITELSTLCQPLSKVIFMLETGSVDVSVFPEANEALLKVIHFLQKTEPFSFLDLASDAEIRHLFDEERIGNMIAYIRAAQENGAVAAFDEKYRHGVGVLKLMQVTAQLGGTLLIYKQVMADFANTLQGGERTPDGYAAAFAEHFSNTDTLSLSNPSWMALTNTTMQYVSADIPLFI